MFRPDNTTQRSGKLAEDATMTKTSIVDGLKTWILTAFGLLTCMYLCLSMAINAPQALRINPGLCIQIWRNDPVFIKAFHVLYFKFNLNIVMQCRWNYGSISLRI